MGGCAPQDLRWVGGALRAVPLLPSLGRPHTQLAQGRSRRCQVGGPPRGWPSVTAGDSAVADRAGRTRHHRPGLSCSLWAFFRLGAWALPQGPRPTKGALSEGWDGPGTSPGTPCPGQGLGRVTTWPGLQGAPPGWGHRPVRRKGCMVRTWSSGCSPWPSEQSGPRSSRCPAWFSLWTRGPHAGRFQNG